MAEWNDDIINRRFTPKEVAALTGVPEDRQRLLASRHFDFRETSSPSSGHRRWSWEGVQTLAAFSEVMADLGKADRALALVQGDQQSMSYQYDGRNDDEDTLLVFHFDHPVLAGASLNTASGLARLYGFQADVRPGRIYTFNLSDLQRRLCEKLQAA